MFDPPTYTVASDALERLAELQAPPDRLFKVRYRIEGELTIRATSPEAAADLAESKRLYDLAERGSLEMDDPEEIGAQP
jgi:hypothetical protein